MAMLREKDKQEVKKHLEEKMQEPVTVTLFTQAPSKIIVPGEQECPSCEETRGLLEEVAALSDKITLRVRDFRENKDEAVAMGVQKIPAIIMDGKKPGSVRYYGIPSGYEFAVLVGMLVDVSRGKTDLSEESKQALATLKNEVHVQVLVTPTCPYCPAAGRLAHQAAMESEKVRADVIEVAEFPQLVQKYAVRGVPKVVFNEDTSMDGAAPEPLFVQQLVAVGGGELRSSS